MKEDTLQKIFQFLVANIREMMMPDILTTPEYNSTDR